MIGKACVGFAVGQPTSMLFSLHWGRWIKYHGELHAIFHVQCHDYVFLFIAASSSSITHGDIQQLTFERLHWTMPWVSFVYKPFSEHLHFCPYVIKKLIVLITTPTDICIFSFKHKNIPRLVSRYYSNNGFPYEYYFKEE